MASTSDLSRRERQIMDVIYRRGKVTVTDVQAELPSAPTAGAMRNLLANLEKKGQIRRDRNATTHTYSPVVPRTEASRNVLRNVVRTFFDGSTSKAMAMLLDSVRSSELTDQELNRMSELVSNARKRSAANDGKD